MMPVEHPASGSESPEGASATTPTPSWRVRKKPKKRGQLLILLILIVFLISAVRQILISRAPEPNAPRSNGDRIDPRSNPPQMIFQETEDLVDGVNEGMPDQELLDQVLNEVVNDGLQPVRD